jgi:hypothetical protein
MKTVILHGFVYFPSGNNQWKKRTILPSGMNRYSMDMNALTGNVETSHAKRRDASRLYNATATATQRISTQYDNSKFKIQNL